MLTMILAMMLVTGSDRPSIALSRTRQLQQAREQKAQNLRVPVRNPLENALFQFKERRVIERFQEGFRGFRPVLGGMTTGSGFAAGTSFERYGFRASAQASIKGYQKYELEYKVPKLDERFFADVRATYRNYGQEPFFGIGMDSRRDNETAYRLEDINYTGTVGIKPHKFITAGIRAGRLDSKTAADTQFLQTGAFIDIDYRDEPGNPRSGGHYTAEWTANRDETIGRHDFGRYNIELQQYIPFFNQRRVIALRGKTSLTRTAPGHDIPFYMLPTLGGSEDLRGFQEFRFRDNNMVVLNAEYRWEAFSGLDLALFADAGQVAAKPTDLDFTDLKTSYGFGVRFNTAKGVFMRIDFGFSAEGRRSYFKFGHVF